MALLFGVCFFLYFLISIIVKKSLIANVGEFWGRKLEFSTTFCKKFCHN